MRDTSASHASKALETKCLRFCPQCQSIRDPGIIKSLFWIPWWKISAHLKNVCHPIEVPPNVCKSQSTLFRVCCCFLWHSDSYPVRPVVLAQNCGRILSITIKSRLKGKWDNNKLDQHYPSVVNSLPPVVNGKLNLAVRGAFHLNVGCGCIQSLVKGWEGGHSGCRRSYRAV